GLDRGARSGCNPRSRSPERLPCRWGATASGGLDRVETARSLLDSVSRLVCLRRGPPHRRPVARATLPLASASTYSGTLAVASPTRDRMIEVHPMRDGFALRLDLGDPLQRAMAAQRRYESDVTWVYPYLLRRGDRVVDGGAHIGYLTLLASRCVGPSGEVHAFEPVPRTFAALGENVRLNRATNVRTNRV